MSRGSRRSIRTATLLATRAVLAAAPAAAPAGTSRGQGRRAGRHPPPDRRQRPRSAADDPRAGRERRHAGARDGFLVSVDGKFVTNYHVIQEAARLSVKLLDGAEYRDVVAGGRRPRERPGADADPRRPRASRDAVGSDVQMEVGDRVFVMGNPLGMGGTFTDGMVSGKRPLEGVAMLQISAPISPGSSGGR